MKVGLDRKVVADSQGALEQLDLLEVLVRGERLEVQGSLVGREQLEDPETMVALVCIYIFLLICILIKYMYQH